MNTNSNTTGRPSAPASKATPTDKQIVDALDALLADVQQLRRAALVLDEYACSEFRSARINSSAVMFEYGFTRTQVEGISYMTDHVRYLAQDLESSIEKAFGLEVEP